MFTYHLHVCLPSSVLPFGFPTSMFVHTAQLPHAYYMPNPCRRPWFHHPNNIWRIIQIMKLFIMHFLQPHVISLRPKYSLRSVYEIWGFKGREMPVVVFWVVTPYQRFREMYRLRLPGVKMEILHPNETLITAYKTTRRHNTSDHKAPSAFP
jgi:hypothetical protein